MYGVMQQFIYYFVDSFSIENHYVIVTYYVTLFVSLFINYLTRHHFCLCGIYVTTYVTPTMTSLRCLDGRVRLTINALPDFAN